MKIRSLFIGLLAATCIGSASAAMTIVQTRTIDSFVPSDSRTLTFNQFDTLGGTRTLQSVTISITYTKTGGRLEVDNDSEESGTIDLTHQILANLTSSDVNLTPTSGVGTVGQAGSMDAVNQLLNVEIGATTGDDTDAFNNTGDVDYVRYDPPNATASTSGDIASSFFNQYTGTDDYTINFNATQDVNVEGVGGLAIAFVPSSVSGEMVVTYTYIPEPTTALLGGLGMLVLFRRRR